MLEAYVKRGSDGTEYFLWKYKDYKIDSNFKMWS